MTRLVRRGGWSLAVVVIYCSALLQQSLLRQHCAHHVHCVLHHQFTTVYSRVLYRVRMSLPLDALLILGQIDSLTWHCKSKDCSWTPRWITFTARICQSTSLHQTSRARQLTPGNEAAWSDSPLSDADAVGQLNSQSSKE